MHNRDENKWKKINLQNTQTGIPHAQQHQRP